MYIFYTQLFYKCILLYVNYYTYNPGEFHDILSRFGSARWCRQVDTLFGIGDVDPPLGVNDLLSVSFLALTHRLSVRELTVVLELLSRHLLGLCLIDSLLLVLIAAGLTLAAYLLPTLRIVLRVLLSLLLFTFSPVSRTLFWRHRPVPFTRTAHAEKKIGI